MTAKITIMKWTKIIGLMDAEYLKEIAESYDEILDIKNRKLVDLESEYKTVSSEEVDGWGLSFRDMADDELGARAHALERMQQVMFRSYLLSVCMVMEDLFRQLCVELQEKYHQKFSLKNMKGTGIWQCLEYIETLTEQRVFTTDIDLKMMIELRNIFIHNNGRVAPKKESELRTEIKKSRLSVDFHEGHIFLHKKDLESYLSVFRNVMYKIGSI